MTAWLIFFCTLCLACMCGVAWLLRKSSPDPMSTPHGDVPNIPAGDWDFMVIPHPDWRPK